MRIYLLNPPYMKGFSRSMRWQEKCRGGTLYYPIWLAYATARLEHANHEVRLVDAPAWKWTAQKVISDVIRYNPDLLVLETSYASLRNDLHIASSIKNVYKNLPTAVVGPPTKMLADNIASSGIADFIIKGEYELSLVKLANHMNESSSNLYRSNANISTKIINGEFCSSSDLNEAPFVSEIYVKHLGIKHYFLAHALYPEVQILAGRGCPFRCTFCEWPAVYTGRITRLREVSNVVDEMEWTRTYAKDVKEIVFEDDTFGLSRPWLSNFLREIIQRKLDVVWSCQVRADLDYPTLFHMKNAGCRQVIVGFESGDETILRNIKKGISIQQIQNFAHNTKKAGLILQGDFIIGLPGENRKTIKKTRRLIEEIKPDILQVSVATPYPGTEFYNWAEKQGYLKVNYLGDYLNDKGHQKSVVSYPDLSDKDIVSEINLILKKYYISPRYIPIALRQIFRKNGFHELKRLILATKAFITY